MFYYIFSVSQNKFSASSIISFLRYCGIEEQQQVSVDGMRCFDRIQNMFSASSIISFLRRREIEDRQVSVDGMLCVDGI